MFKYSSVALLLLTFTAHCVFANVLRYGVENINAEQTANETQTDAAGCSLPSRCYKGKSFYFETDIARNKVDAQNFCHSISSKLVSIQTAEKDAFIFNTIKSNRACASKSYYTSGYLSSTKEFSWITGEKFTHTNWRFDQPSMNNAPCVQYWGRDSYAQWDDCDCTDKRFYICESNYSC